MSMGIVAVIFLFLCGCLAALAVLIRSSEYFTAGFLAVLMIAGLMLFAGACSPDGQTEALRSEISDLKSQIETLKDMANNPAYLAGICLAGAAGIVALIFFGIYGLLIVQAKIRMAEKTGRSGRYLPQGAHAVHQVPDCPEPAKAVPEYSQHDRYAVTQYQGY